MFVCPNCARQLPDNTIQCPHCGASVNRYSTVQAPVAVQTAEKKKSRGKSLKFLGAGALAVLAIFILLVTMFPNEKSDTSSQTATSQSTNSAASTQSQSTSSNTSESQRGTDAANNSSTDNSSSATSAASDGYGYIFAAYDSSVKKNKIGYLFLYDDNRFAYYQNTDASPSEKDVIKQKPSAYGTIERNNNWSNVINLIFDDTGEVHRFSYDTDTTTNKEYLTEVDSSGNTLSDSAYYEKLKNRASEKPQI